MFGVENVDRIILHLDCNSFYASVKFLHRPEILISRLLWAATRGNGTESYWPKMSRRRNTISKPVRLFGRRGRNILIWVIAPTYFRLFQHFSKLCYKGIPS